MSSRHAAATLPARRGASSAPILSCVLLALLLAAPAAAAPFTFAVISDTHILRRGGEPASLYPATRRIVAEILRARPAFVVHAGDMMSLNRGDGEPLARAHMALVREGILAPLDSAGIPLYPTPGNHDAIAGGRAVYGEIFAARLGAAPLLFGTLGEDYAFRFGNALFVSLDGSGVAWRKGTLARLEAFLAREKRAGDVAFVVTHIGLVPGRRHKTAKLARVTAEELAALGVDVLICGHQHAHALDRTGGLLHVTCGSAGETKPYPWLLVTVDGTDVRVERREGIDLPQDR